jgi:hypothetical protein
MASNRDNEIMNRLMELNKKRFIPKRRKFTKAEQTEFDLLFFGLREKDQEILNDVLDETPDYRLANK